MISQYDSDTIRLNEDYNASIDRMLNKIEVGCQSFSFDKLKELYEKTFNE
jgi:hypothetical protein